MARVVALIFATLAVLGVAWFLYQDSHTAGIWALVLGVLLFVGPLLYSIADNNSD